AVLPASPELVWVPELPAVRVSVVELVRRISAVVADVDAVL
ncbi:MAG: hypothetical protein QOG69_1023, partial [Actinomycetota bacterium]|nr:hypothetical protein [Actinomycetota bacterium]